jgi:hypothetical protein
VVADARIGGLAGEGKGAGGNVVVVTGALVVVVGSGAAVIEGSGAVVAPPAWIGGTGWSGWATGNVVGVVVGVVDVVAATVVELVEVVATGPFVAGFFTDLVSFLTGTPVLDFEPTALVTVARVRTGTRRLVVRFAGELGSVVAVCARVAPPAGATPTSERSESSASSATPRGKARRCMRPEATAVIRRQVSARCEGSVSFDRPLTSASVSA